VLGELVRPNSLLTSLNKPNSNGTARLGRRTFKEF
jgi:hypothetical protein